MRAKFIAYCEKQQMTEGQTLYDLINQDPLGFKAQLHQAWPDVFEAPETGTGKSAGT